MAVPFVPLASMALPAYDFWLFDFDGTLVDVDPAYARSLVERIGDRIGYAFSPEQIEVIWHGLGGSRDEALRQWGLDPTRFWEAFHDVEDPADRVAATHLYDDAFVIADLEAPVGLVTHCQQYLTDPILDHLGIRDWFDTVVCCTPTIGWKPDPAPVRLAMSNLGVKPAANGSAGVLVGDGPHDIGAAWNAGLDGIHIERHDPDYRGQCVLGDYRIESFRTFTE